MAQSITEILAAWREIADVRDADRDGDFDPYSEAVAETLRSCADEIERALGKSSEQRQEIRQAAREVVDDYFDEPYDDDGYSPASLDALADDAAERHYNRD